MFRISETLKLVCFTLNSVKKEGFLGGYLKKLSNDVMCNNVVALLFKILTISKCDWKVGTEKPWYLIKYCVQKK